ncbi:pirin family protein [Tahibacter amnicola]|uniref:Pirin family protein n=1 Tax=Tahibacter amnicola TaxID=2976241 RepID=A0ABY6BFW4_9GAMM|nr:pirin family protein [Tahibacter amnicola]UXI68916.1 pirin family protein [Tahibacter amnicola]
MRHIHRAADRGHTTTGWLDSWHTFSFGQFYDRERMGFGPLRVINEDRVAPGGGFGTHGHANMEILTWVISGALQHRDSLGNGSVIRPGELQRMSAGSGIEHSEFNASPSEPVHFLQIWIQPNRSNARPGYAQKTFATAVNGQLVAIASPDGANGAIPVLADATLFAADLAPGAAVAHTSTSPRLWVQVVSGALVANGEALASGDGLALRGEQALSLQTDAGAQVLVFELPD